MMVEVGFLHEGADGWSELETLCMAPRGPLPRCRWVDCAGSALAVRPGPPVPTVAAAHPEGWLVACADDDVVPDGSAMFQPLQGPVPLRGTVFITGSGAEEGAPRMVIRLRVVTPAGWHPHLAGGGLLLFGGLLLVGGLWLALSGAVPPPVAEAPPALAVAPPSPPAVDRWVQVTTIDIQRILNQPGTSPSPGRPGPVTGSPPKAPVGKKGPVAGPAGGPQGTATDGRPGAAEGGLPGLEPSRTLGSSTRDRGLPPIDRPPSETVTGGSATATTGDRGRRDSVHFSWDTFCDHCGEGMLDGILVRCPANQGTPPPTHLQARLVEAANACPDES